MALTETTTKREAYHQAGDIVSYPINGGANVGNICAGCLAVLVADGYLQTYAPDGVTTPIFAGVVCPDGGYDNTAGSAGDAEVNVYRRGIFRMNFSANGTALGTATQADVGSEVYLVNNDTVCLLDSVPTADVKVGKITRFVDANTVEISIDGYAA